MSDSKRAADLIIRNARVATLVDEAMAEAVAVANSLALEPGKAADFTVLSEDLLSVETDRIPHIVADLTVTAGKVVCQRDGL